MPLPLVQSGGASRTANVLLGLVRDRVFERDRGVCAVCGLDCIAEFQRLKRLRGPARIAAVSAWNVRSRMSLWDADHIVPVVEGGGECDLSNMRTLCLRCHRTHTQQLRERVRVRRAEAASGDQVRSSGG